MDPYTQIKKRKGYSLVEILVGIGILATIASSVTLLVVGSFGLNERESNTLKVLTYSKEASSGIEAISAADWRDLIIHSDNKTYGLSNSNGYWEFIDSQDTYKNLSRKIQIIDVYRNSKTGDIVSQSEKDAILDPNTKKIQIEVNLGDTNIKTTKEIANWQSQDWKQTDWSGGSGQLIFSDPSMYFSDDGNIDIAKQGQIELSRNQGSLAQHGKLISSAFKTFDDTNLEFVYWTNKEPHKPCTSCSIKIQIRTAPDDSNSPGAWTNWFGSDGEGTYFTGSEDEIIPFDITQNTWVQYKAILEGYGTTTPILLDLGINYK